MIPIQRISSIIFQNPLLKPISAVEIAASLRRFSSRTGDDDWNDAWETAWLPEDLSGKTRAPWEIDVNFSLSERAAVDAQSTQIAVPSDIDSETKAFVEDMTENWEQRKGKSGSNTNRNVNGEMITKDENVSGPPSSSLYSLKNMKRDYRLKKQRVHAGLWMKEIEKMEEAKLADTISGGDDIEKLLDSCSEIFDSSNSDLSNSNIPTTELKSKPDGWETMARAQDGSVWEMSQREEDILLQEFERRIAFNKFQIASFIKTHIFSRRRPIDGWKYMIEQIGPNARKGKGSVSRLPSVSDAATQPLKEENSPIRSGFVSNKGR